MQRSGKKALDWSSLEDVDLVTLKRSVVFNDYF